MRIAYIGRFDVRWNELGISECLKSLGHEVLELEEGSSKIVERILEWRPDFVLCAKLRVDNASHLITVLKHEKIPLVSWTFDLYWDYVREPHIPTYPFLKADLVVTTDGGHDERWKEAGIPHVTIRQGIHPKDAWIAKVPHQYDVVFVGSYNSHHPYRQQMLAALQENFNLAWFGLRDEMRGEKLNNLIGSAKIILGDSVISPNYWSNRIYETIGRGGFYIHPFVEGIDKEFTPDQEAVYYEPYNLGELMDKIAYYLKAEDEREAIAQAGFARCVKEHNFINRCKTLCEILEQRIIGIRES